MPLTPEMRRSIDQIRDYLYGGGYPDPVSNAEQLSFLFFFYLVEGIDAENIRRAKVLKKPYNSMFAGEWKLRNPLNAPAAEVTTENSGKDIVQRITIRNKLNPSDIIPKNSGIIYYDQEN
jgi:type I restriction enzyme M protein